MVEEQKENKKFKIVYEPEEAFAGEVFKKFIIMENKNQSKVGLNIKTYI